MELICKLEKLKHKLIELNFRIEGIGEYEIQKIESYYSVNLPFYYKYFLSFMGKSGGAFMRGESIFYDSLFDLKEGLIELIQEDNSPFELNENHFVFYSHQGYVFAFFDVSLKISPIFIYSEEILEPYIKYESLDHFLNEYLENLEIYLKE
jgi:hypothetical protein